MQGNNYGLLVKTIKKFPKPNLQCELLGVWMNINRVRLQHDSELIMFRFYFPLFMVLLCVILKAFDIYARHFEYSPACDVYVRLKTKGAGCPVPIFPIIHIPIFSYFYTKTSYFFLFFTTRQVKPKFLTKLKMEL